QILELARQRGKRVKAVGGGHSPSDIACSEDFMIHMGKINRILQVDKEKLQVKVEAGILLSELNPELEKHGMALANLGAVSEVTAAGVIGTGTHNTGIGHGILPTQVVAVSLLLASGEILECSESVNPEVFQAARLHLGCLGIVVSVTFQCVPKFRLREVAFPSTLSRVLDELDEHLRKSQYFRFLWFPHSENVRIIYQDPTSKPPCSSSSWFWDYAVGYYLLEFLLWISPFIPMEIPGCQSRTGPFPWNSQIPVRSHGNCQILVQDWAIPMKIPKCREKTKEALLELKAALERNSGMVAHFPVEIRFSRRDEILLSPCFRRDSCYINVIMYRPYGKDIPRLRYWLAYEEIMRKHGGRPHWAKVPGKREFPTEKREFPK
ncbi:GGLO oxidase, partial [Rhabdornis inornatus]|nr:GGLO oxidase [Rhabdornis inornatus]